MPVTAGAKRLAPATRRVCFVAPSAYPLGGVATWLDALVPALHGLGWRARVVLTDGVHHDAGAYERAHPAIARALRVRCATGTAQGRVRALAAALAREAPDVVVGVNVPDALLAAARLKAGRRDGPLAVMSVHGLEPDLFADAAWLAPALDGIVCTNRLSQACALQRTGLDPERVRYAPYGTPVGPLPDPPTRRDLVVGFAGRFDRFQKRVQDLVPIADALATLGVDARWLVAGSGPDQHDVDALGHRHPHAVELLGPLAAADMAQRFFARCDVLLNPSAWETGPIVVWEAMAHGVTVVSTRYVGSGLEGALVDGESCLLFGVGDAAGAAGALARAADPALRARLRTAAHRLVSTRYSPGASARAWADAIEAIAARAARRGRPPAPPPAGRLDRWLGAVLAERVRGAAGRRFVHVDAGGEWPHAYSDAARADATHWAALRALDASTAGHDGRGCAARAVVP